MSHSLAQLTVRANFEFIKKLGVDYWCFHDRDIAPDGETLKVIRILYLSYHVYCTNRQAFRNFSFICILHCRSSFISVYSAVHISVQEANSNLDEVVSLAKELQVNL